MVIYYNPYNKSRNHCPAELIPQAEKLMRYLRRNVPKQQLSKEMNINIGTLDRWYLNGGLPGRVYIPKLLERYAKELENFNG